MSKPKKSSDKVLVSFNVDRDMYFEILAVCLREKMTIDEFVELALKDFIKNYSPKTKKK